MKGFFSLVKYKNNKDTFYLFSRSVILWENLAGAFRDTPCRKKLLLDHDFLLFLRLLVNQKKILTNIETVQLPRAPTRAGQAAGRPTLAGQAACLSSARWGRRAAPLRLVTRHPFSEIRCVTLARAAQWVAIHFWIFKFFKAVEK